MQEFGIMFLTIILAAFASSVVQHYLLFVLDWRDKGVAGFLAALLIGFFVAYPIVYVGFEIAAQVAA